MVRNLTCLGIVSGASTALSVGLSCNDRMFYTLAVQYSLHPCYSIWQSPVLRGGWDPKFKFPCVTSGCPADHTETSYMENRLRGAAGDLVQLVETPGFYPQYNTN